VTGPPGTPLPLFIEADAMEGVQDDYLEAQGAVKVRRYGERVEAEKLRYQQSTDDMHAEGQVRLVQQGNVVDGSSADLNLETRRGHIEQPVFQLAQPGGRGTAAEFTLEGEQRYFAKDTSYTTCPVGVNDWMLHLDDLQVDNVRQVATGHNARLDFMGVPILYTPYIDFPTSDQRKSGLLPPVFGSTQTTGTDITVPYYWNIAPNMDATIAPRFMSKRGIMLDGEYRYLFQNFNGALRGDYLDHDSETGTDRWGVSLQHNQNLGYGFSGAVNFQRVSDDNFLRDFGNRIAVTSLTILPQDVYVSYGAGWWSALARYETWQTLQDPVLPVTPPYNREPQFVMNAGKQNLRGFDLGFTGEIVNFRNPQTTQVSGDRLLLYPTLSYPIVSASSFLIPRASWHYTHYAFEGTSSDRPDEDLSVPILSLDGGLVFERPWTLGGEDFVQTLEPRAFYVYAPFRDQNTLPVYDTAEADFNFAQLFLENRFVGSDRVNDANEITLAVTSRLIEPASGDERVRVAIGQRFFFNSPRVTLGPTLPSDTQLTKSDVLAGVSARIGSQWLMDSVWQYSPSLGRTEKFSFGARYQPEPGKLANLGYRFTSQTLEQIGGSVQWPVAGGLWALGMLDYSLQDNRALNAVLGVEYNSACWALRMVVQRFATSATDTTNQFFLQLELRGLAKLGSDPVETLRQNIPGYKPVPVPVTPIPRALEY
jgi:LPS-assembly protein